MKRAQLTDTVPALPGLVIVITPPHMHMAVQAEWSAGWPLTITVAAPGVQGLLVAGTQGAGVRTPIAAEVAAATTGFDGVPHIPNDGMLTIGADAWMLAAVVPALTGVPIGTTLSGIGAGGIAIEQVIIAPWLTSGGTAVDSTLRERSDQTPGTLSELGATPVRRYVSAVLPEIVLDDIRFQELVNEARTRILRHSPDWTDHNVSDPGITLIELFAWITEILTYRINRIPRRTHLALLNIIGVQPAPPQRACVDVRFVLVDPIGAVIPAGTAVASPRAAGGDLVVFQTDEELVVPAFTMVAFALERPGELHTLEVSGGAARSSGGQPMFGSPPEPGNALLFGFEQPLERLVVRLSFDCTPAAGERVDRDNPPLAWEVSGTGGEWLAAEVVSDETAGFTEGGGNVLVEVPEGADSMNVGGRELRWIRCRVTRGRYSRSPDLNAVSASVIGGTAGASHAEAVHKEMLGTSDGIAGTTYPLQHGPVLALEEGETLEVREPSGTAWVAWQHVADFRAATRDDSHFNLDLITGEVRFGPAIRQPDGGWRSYGALPPAGSALRFTRYRHGGGEAGNIAPRTLSMLPVPIEGVASVTNPRPGHGGSDAESLASARERARLEVQSRTRAVTVEDFERLTLAASSEVARAICVASGDSGPVRVHILPRVEPADRRLELSELIPTAELMETVAAALDRRRLLGTSIKLLPARLKGISVAVDVRASPLADLERVQYDVEHALYVYLNPLIGGSPDGPGPGWPSGRRLSQGELYGIVYSIPGVEFINTLLTYETDLDTGSQAPGSTDGEISLADDELIASGQHTVKAIHRE